MAYPWRLMWAVAFAATVLVRMRDHSWTGMQLFGVWVSILALQNLGWVFYAVILWPKFFSPLRKLPEPSGNSFWNGQGARIANEPSGFPHREWIQSVPAPDGIMRYLGMLNQERVFISGPKALAEVLVSRSYDFPKPQRVQQLLGRLLGDGVLIAEGDQHRFQRRKLMPAFSFRHTKDLYPVFWQKSTEGVEAMTKAISTESEKESSLDPEKAAAGKSGKSAVLAVQDWASRITLDIIGVAGMGQDFHAIQNPGSGLNNIYRRIFQPTRQAQILGLLANFLPAFVIDNLPVKRNNDIADAVREIRAISRDLIIKKKEKLARKELTDVDILSVALESGGFSDEDLIDQLMTFLAAGHETTATAMIWAVYMLARFPDIQRRLRAEIRANLPSPSDPNSPGIDSTQIDRLPYLNAFCNELLRYYAPVPLTLRETASDTTIQGQFIPRGTTIIISAWATNFDPTLWGEDVNVFNPDRWLTVSDDKSNRSSSSNDGSDGETEDRKSTDGSSNNLHANASGGASSNYALLTFLHGPRSCIGQGFAKAEFACLMASWAGRFSFELEDKEMMDEKKVRIKGGITSKPHGGLNVHVGVVDGW